MRIERSSVVKLNIQCACSVEQNIGDRVILITMFLKNGEFDCVIKRTGEKYDDYECKYFNSLMRKSECEEEQVQLRDIQGIEVARIGFVSTGGFDFRDEKEFMLVDG